MIHSLERFRERIQLMVSWAYGTGFLIYSLGCIILTFGFRIGRFVIVTPRWQKETKVNGMNALTERVWALSSLSFRFSLEIDDLLLLSAPASFFFFFIAFPLIFSTGEKKILIRKGRLPSPLALG